MKHVPAVGGLGFIIVDDGDEHRLTGYTWRIRPDGYVYTTVKRRVLLAARLLLDARPQDVVMYRTDARHDLRRSTNIFIGTRAAARRRSVARMKYKQGTGFVGVTYSRRGYIVRVRGGRGGKQYDLYAGRFTDVFEAALAYNIAIKELTGAISDANTIPKREAERVYRQWGLQLPPGLDLSRRVRKEAEGVPADGHHEDVPGVRAGMAGPGS